MALIDDATRPSVGVALPLPRVLGACVRVSPPRRTADPGCTVIDGAPIRPLYSAHPRAVPPSRDVPDGRRSGAVDTLTLLIIIIVVLFLLGGGGYWYRGRR